MKLIKTLSAIVLVLTGLLLCSVQAQRTATATPTVANGFVIAITVTDGGSGYTNAPTVTISGGGGSGAIAVATVSNGAVDKIIVQNAGNGYSGNLSVIIAAPPSPSKPRMNLIKAVKPSFSDLYIGTIYQLQVSGDLNTWTNHGMPFTATNKNIVFPQSWDVDNWEQLFFRLAPNHLVLIPAGSFQMGDSFSEGDSNELPVHTVYVSDFYIECYVITKEQWDDVYAWAIQNGYRFDNAGSGKVSNHPVNTVNWFDVLKWCNARSEKESKVPAYYTSANQITVYRTGQLTVENDWVNWNSGYRLPTEAEWEKAARGGANGRRFPWSDRDTIDHTLANYFSDGSYTYDTSATQGFHPIYNDGVLPYTSLGWKLYSQRIWAIRHDRKCNASGAGMHTTPTIMHHLLLQTLAGPSGSSFGFYGVNRKGRWSNMANECRVAKRWRVTRTISDYRSFRVVLPTK